MTARSDVPGKRPAKSTCSVCGWRDPEPPGACATDGCGLADVIHDRRNRIRAKLGLPALARPQKVAKVRALPRAKPAVPAAPAPVPDAPPAGGVDINDLQPRSCRWPHGDPRKPALRYCGARSVAPGKPYCRHHHGIAWRRSEAAHAAE